MQDYISSNKIKENKYKILRMSLLLGADESREETLNNFEDASRDIDAMNDDIYLKDLEGKFYETSTLEEEEKKLTVLVDYIGGRVEQRISLLSDFANVTGYDLQGLPPIKYYDRLDDYKERLKYIGEYLKNTESINVLKVELETDEKKLNETYISKATAEECNLRFEDVLKNKFNSLISDLDFFEGVTEENIDEEITTVIYNVDDSKKSLDIFTKSFATLSTSGISASEEEEYLSYVEGAQDAFYKNKEQEYLLKIYKLLTNKYSDYTQIMIKREEINDILYERINLRKNFRIPGNDILSSLYDLLERQYEDIKRQSGTIEKIDALNNSINSKKESLNELEQENQKVEILSLLREYSIIDTYSDLSFNNEIKEEDLEDDVEDDVEDTTSDNDSTIPDLSIDFNDIELDKKESSSLFEEPVQTEELVINNDIFEEEVKDNQVINVENSIGIDLDLIHSKASKVMKRVGEMLGIKVEEEVIVSVTNEKKPELETNVIPEPNPVPDTNDITNENPFFEENDIEIPTEQVENIENPLFGSDFNVETPTNEITPTPSDPEFSSLDTSANNDFWFPSDTPDALNELPDLEISNDNFFTNNNMSDLQFPDLNINFGTNDSEENK